MYVTPIIYSPPQIKNEALQTIMKYNPLTDLVGNARDWIKDFNVSRNEECQVIIQKAIQQASAWKSRYMLHKLLSHKSPKLNAIGQALRETLDKTISQEEQTIVSRIEECRRFLLESEKTISVIDYGAGSRDAKRTEDEMRRGVKYTASVSKVCEASKSAFLAFLLFKLIRKLSPTSCLELGSYVGISASYQAAALLLNNNNGKLLTLEGSPETANIAKETLAGLGLANAFVMVGPFHETYPNALQCAKPIDFLFNDGHHDHDAMLKYFAEALPYLAEESVVIFDDISWSPGMQKAWARIKNDMRVVTTIDLHAVDSMGIAIISSETSTKSSFSITLQE